MSAETPGGRNIYFGVREHGMGAALNGMAAHGGVIPFGGDVPRVLRLLPAGDPHRRAERVPVDLRLHARQRRPRRGRPDAPADRAPHGAAGDAAAHASSGPPTPNETAMAWKAAIEYQGPTALALSRQARAAPAGHGERRRARPSPRRVRRQRGAQAPARPTRSSSRRARRSASPSRRRSSSLERGVRARVVSMPCWELFEEQDDAYRDEVLPPRRDGARVRRGRRHARLAALGRRRGRDASASTAASVPRRRARPCSRSSASRRNTSSSGTLALVERLSG